MRKFIICFMVCFSLFSACEKSQEYENIEIESTVQNQIVEESASSINQMELQEEKASDDMEPEFEETMNAFPTESIESISGSESVSEEMVNQEIEILKQEETSKIVEESEVLTDTSDFVSKLSIASNTQQLIVVQAHGNQADFSMHKMVEGEWTCILETTAQIGDNGIGKTKEGDRKTPLGVYEMASFAFGNQSNPGTELSYTQTDSSWYWVDDSQSKYYNQFVSTHNVEQDWTSAEHIANVKNAYNYVIPINYNVECVPGAGSAIFLHCRPSGGAGCIAIDQDSMITVLQSIKKGCLIIIDTEENIYAY